MMGGKPIILEDKKKRRITQRTDSGVMKCCMVSLSTDKLQQSSGYSSVKEINQTKRKGHMYLGWRYLDKLRETYDNVKYIYCKITFPLTSHLAIEVDSNIFSSLIFILYFICHMIYVYKNHSCER